MITLILVLLMVIFTVGVGAYMYFSSKEEDDAAITEAEFEERMERFIDQMDERQLAMAAELKGASETELFFTLEARIQELEAKKKK